MDEVKPLPVPPMKEMSDKKPKKKAEKNSKVQEDDEFEFFHEFKRENVKTLIHIITNELKNKGMDIEYLFLPFRPEQTNEKLLSFLNAVFPLGNGQPVSEDKIVRIIAKTDSWTLFQSLKYIWCRLPRGEIVGWRAYNEFKIKEAEEKYSQKSFLEIIPKCLDSPNHASIVYDFFDLIVTMASNTKKNKMSGRKVAKMSAVWAFQDQEETDSAGLDVTAHRNDINGYKEGLDRWVPAAEAMFHLLLAFIRSFVPTDSTKTNLPKSLRAILFDNAYPPKPAETFASETILTVPIVTLMTTTFSRKPWQLIERCNELMRFDDPEEFKTREDYALLKSLFKRKKNTEGISSKMSKESKRLMKCLSTKHSTFQAGWSKRKALTSPKGDHISDYLTVGQIEIDDYFIWAWLSSLSYEQTAQKRKLFGRSLILEFEFDGFKKWVVLQESDLILENKSYEQIDQTDFIDTSLPSTPKDQFLQQVEKSDARKEPILTSSTRSQPITQTNESSLQSSPQLNIIRRSPSPELPSSRVIPHSPPTVNLGAVSSLPRLQPISHDLERKEREEREERQRLELESLENERLKRENLDRERMELERLEKERIALEKLEREKLELERKKLEVLERERLERERQETERLERETVEREKAERARLQKESLDRERLDHERREEQKREEEKAQQEKSRKEMLEHENLRSKISGITDSSDQKPKAVPLFTSPYSKPAHEKSSSDTSQSNYVPQYRTLSPTPSQFERSAGPSVADSVRQSSSTYDENSIKDFPVETYGRPKPVTDLGSQDKFVKTQPAPTHNTARESENHRTHGTDNVEGNRESSISDLTNLVNDMTLEMICADPGDAVKDLDASIKTNEERFDTLTMFDKYKSQAEQKQSSSDLNDSQISVVTPLNISTKEQLEFVKVPQINEKHLPEVPVPAPVNTSSNLSPANALADKHNLEHVTVRSKGYRTKDNNRNSPQFQGSDSLSPGRTDENPYNGRSYNLDTGARSGSPQSKISGPNLSNPIHDPAVEFSPPVIENTEPFRTLAPRMGSHSPSPRSHSPERYQQPMQSGYRMSPEPFHTNSRAGMIQHNQGSADAIATANVGPGHPDRHYRPSQANDSNDVMNDPNTNAHQQYVPVSANSPTVAYRGMLPSDSQYQEPYSAQAVQAGHSDHRHTPSPPDVNSGANRYPNPTPGADKSPTPNPQDRFVQGRMQARPQQSYNTYSRQPGRPRQGNPGPQGGPYGAPPQGPTNVSPYGPQRYGPPQGAPLPGYGAAPPQQMHMFSSPPSQQPPGHYPIQYQSPPNPAVGRYAPQHSSPVPMQHGFIPDGPATNKLHGGNMAKKTNRKKLYADIRSGNFGI